MAGFIEQIYGELLRCYPVRFYRQYGDEMLDVFRLRLKDARREGCLSYGAACAHELVDVSLLVIRERIRDNFSHKLSLMEAIMSVSSLQTVRTARKVARGFGLVIALFVFYVLSRQGTDSMALLVLTFVGTTAAMFAAWRWERMGGLLTIAGAVLIGFAGVSATYSYMAAHGVIVWWALVIAFLLWTWPFLLVGWLFVKASGSNMSATQAQA